MNKRLYTRHVIWQHKCHLLELARDVTVEYVLCESMFTVFNESVPLTCINCGGTGTKIVEEIAELLCPTF